MNVCIGSMKERNQELKPGRERERERIWGERGTKRVSLLSSRVGVRVRGNVTVDTNTYIVGHLLGMTVPLLTACPVNFSKTNNIKINFSKTNNTENLYSYN